MKTLRMLFYLVRRFPVYVIGFFVNEILMALPSYVGNVLFLKYLMQALLEGEPISEMLVLLAGTAVFLIMADVYTAWFSSKYMPCAEECIQREFYYRIRNATEEYGLDAYDNPKFYDDMTYINERICKDSLALLSYVSKITAGLINIILIINLFYEIGLEVLLIAISAVAFSLAFDVPLIRVQNKRNYAVSSIERKRKYFRDCFWERESFQERKMTSVNTLLYSKYEESVGEQVACERQFGMKLFLLSSLRELLSTHLLMNFTLIAYLLYRVLVTRTLRGSDFIATYNAVNVIMTYIMQMVKLWERMAPCTYTVGKYFRFITDLPQKEQYRGKEEREHSQKNKRCREESFEKIHSIEFRNVKFSYPGTDKIVLKGISFCIHSGEKIAIVGRNGSGKTTLVHLLMGLYYPTEGEILVNGKLLDRERYPQYRRKFTAFFQGMKPLEATIAENVALDTEIDLERLSMALQKTNCEGLLSQPENTMVGVQFDPAGLILSGGQNQKLMLAHCFYSDRPMLVMDEPSSALDPVAERDFNRRVSELAGNKLTVFVTHRLSTVHMANYIYVIHDGRLCDRGSHEELMRKDGVYRDMWNVQLEKYGNV